ncbi:hypothetical protein BP5796_09820 [Coleophoma crateriformis]|uniref:Alcohol dehydrogenase-like C-terminal domain-containing protein n=1 Tax=Coleophoma crateriformis TaxID=565419 RepID=A0A3D8QZI0_9HELO|nr:hypothetical protein BP5796_09820 [Coleophoma crateriformis]
MSVGKGTTVVAQATVFATSMGSNVIATSPPDAKLRISKKLGASESIKYKATPGGDEIIRLTDEEEFDLVTVFGGFVVEANSLHDWILDFSETVRNHEPARGSREDTEAVAVVEEELTRDYRTVIEKYGEIGGGA